MFDGGAEGTASYVIHSQLTWCIAHDQLTLKTKQVLKGRNLF